MQKNYKQNIKMINKDSISTLRVLEAHKQVGFLSPLFSTTLSHLGCIFYCLGALAKTST